MKLIMENWRNFKKTPQMPKLNPPERIRNPNPEYPDMVKDRPELKIDQDPQDPWRAKVALQKGEDSFIKSDMPTSISVIDFNDPKVRAQIGLFVDKLSKRVDQDSALKQARKRELQKQIDDVKRAIARADTVEVAPPVHVSASLDTLDIVEMVDKLVNEIMESVEDGKN